MRQLPRCPLTDLIRLECGCPDHSNSFTMTEGERDYLRNPGPVARPERLYPVLRKGDYRPLGIGEYVSRPWTEPRDVKVVDSTNLCGVAGCTRPAGDAFVCPQCVDDLDVALGDTAALADELELAASRQANVAQSGYEVAKPTGATRWDRVLRRDESEFLAKVGFNSRPDVPHAMELLHGLENAVVAGIKALVEHRGITPPVILEVTTGSRWLLMNISAVALDPAGPDIVGEVREAAARAMRAIDGAPGGIYLRVCDICKARMYADPDAQWHNCTTCGARYDVAARLESINSTVRDSLLSLSEIAEHSERYIGRRLTIGQLKGWVRRDMLQKAGTAARQNRPGEDQALYRVEDVIRLMEKRRRAEGAA